MATKSNKNMKKNVVNNETKLVCPKCGAEFEIPNKSSVVKNATVIGADSNLGTIYMKLKDRQEELTKAGIDTSKYFSMMTPQGIEKLMKWEGDTPVAVDASDPVLKSILESGAIPNKELFRRWVMAQVFRGLSYKDYKNRPLGFTDWIKAKGYKYTWKMVTEELRVQIKLYGKGDFDNYSQRNRWFNRELIVKMIDHYVKSLNEMIEDKPVHKCKGVPYICIGGKNVFSEDVYQKLILPIREIEDRIACADTPAALYNLVRGLQKKMINLGYDNNQCPDWIDAYKGAGAYYTMKNMIMFHDCIMRSDKGTFLSKSGSLKALEKLASEYSSSCEGWRMVGVMKKLIKDNHIDIEAKRKEWAKKSHK